ncbi:hypothetical protein E4U59_007025 [Claviceps monticola]|nr:hypothetical protein E4U59_007025 [Claviceps monticola]
MDSTHHGAHGPPEADTGSAHVTIASVTTTTLIAGLPQDHEYHGDPAACSRPRTSTCIDSSTASTSKILRRYDYHGAWQHQERTHRPQRHFEPSDQGPIPGTSQVAVRLLARDRVSCGCKSQTACNTNNCSCRRANVLCGKWYHKGDTPCGNLTDAKLEAAQKEEHARQQTEKLLLAEQRVQQLTGVLHQSQVDPAERAEKAARELRHQQQQHLQLGSADFISAPNHTRIRQRTGQHPL